VGLRLKKAVFFARRAIMMGKKRYLIILSLSISVLFPNLNIHAAQPIELKLASYHPATGVSVADVLVPWA
jgi:hypothetical protein